MATDQLASLPAPGLPSRGSLAFIKFYQKWLSPYLGTHCRFQPSCSRYTFEAILRFGFFRGWFLGIYRIIRCNPFNPGGHDPVPKLTKEPEFLPQSAQGTQRQK